MSLNIYPDLTVGQKIGEDEEMVDVEGYEDEDSMFRSIRESSQANTSFKGAFSQDIGRDKEDSMMEAPSETLDSILLQDLQHSDSDDSDDDDDDFPFGDGEEEEEEEELEEESQDMFNFSGNADDSMDAMDTSDTKQACDDANDDDEDDDDQD